MTHTFYIAMSYGLTGVIVSGLVLAVWLGGRARRAELAALEAAGVRRRSAMRSGEGRT